MWIITGKCNLRCRHCYASLFSSEEELPTSTVIEILKGLYEMGMKRVDFVGGEPLLRRDLLDILTFCKELGVEYVTVFTNSILLDHDIASKLYRLEVGVMTSLDGPNKEVHERIRGEGAWERTLKGIEVLRRSVEDFHINITITTLNWKEVAATIDKALELGASSVSVIPAMPAGRALENKLYPDAKTYSKVLRLVKEKAEERKKLIELWCTPFAGFVNSDYLCYGNCRGYSGLDISPSGNVLLCDVLGIRISNVVEKGLRGAWEEYINSELYMRVGRRIRVREPCKSCNFLFECLGGCYARRYKIKGELEGPDPLCPLAYKEVTVGKSSSHMLDLL
ncbi:MAG: radical SAM protein [Candidatus Methanospirareceae archaeon]